MSISQARLKELRAKFPLKFDPSEPIPGYKERLTPISRVKVVEIDFWADPTKRDPAWEANMRRKMVDDRKFRREFLRDWTLGAGDSFYPEFEILGGRKTYVRRLAGVLVDLPIYRGWDFGFRKPACVWLQYSPRSKRIYVLREWSPEDVDTYTVCDVVKFASGQIELEDLDPQGMKWIERFSKDPSLPPLPWFPRLATPLQFIDFCGPEALKVTPSVHADTKERTDYDILWSKGIQVSWNSVSHKRREHVIRKLLKIRKDGIPGIIFDKAAHTLIKAFGGGLTYPEPTKAEPLHDEPKKDKYFEHLHDALGYAVTQIVPAEDIKDDALAAAAGQYVFNGRIAIPAREVLEDEQTTLAFYETRVGR